MSSRFSGFGFEMPQMDTTIFVYNCTLTRIQSFQMILWFDAECNPGFYVWIP
jgi:hypothetical protein